MKTENIGSFSKTQLSFISFALWAVAFVVAMAVLIVTTTIGIGPYSLIATLSIVIGLVMRYALFLVVKI